MNLVGQLCHLIIRIASYVITFLLFSQHCYSDYHYSVSYPTQEFYIHSTYFPVRHHLHIHSIRFKKKYDCYLEGADFETIGGSNDYHFSHPIQFTVASKNQFSFYINEDLMDKNEIPFQYSSTLISIDINATSFKISCTSHSRILEQKLKNDRPLVKEMITALHREQDNHIHGPSNFTNKTQQTTPEAINCFTAATQHFLSMFSAQIRELAKDIPQNGCDMVNMKTDFASFRRDLPESISSTPTIVSMCEDINALLDENTNRTSIARK